MNRIIMLEKLDENDVCIIETALKEVRIKCTCSTRSKSVCVEGDNDVLAIAVHILNDLGFSRV